MSIKKLVLLSAVCAAAVMLVPVASASAAKLEGKCTVNGSAFFSKGLLSEVEGEHGYEFVSKNKGVVCVENGTNKVREGSATVTGGTFKGTCLKEGKSLVEGEGALKLTSPGETFPFKLAFTSNNGTVSLKIKNAKGEETATGTASFAASVKQPAAQCPTTGVSELEFSATAEGTIGE